MNKKMLHCRKEIDKIDSQILSLLKERFQLIKKISYIKVQYNLAVRDQKRIEEILKKRLDISKKYQIPIDLVKKIFKDIIFYSMKEEKKWLKKKTKK